jgi:hypothetical protein
MTVVVGYTSSGRKWLRSSQGGRQCREVRVKCSVYKKDVIDQLILVQQTGRGEVKSGHFGTVD